MNLEWIDDLLAIIDTGSLSQAAQSRFITQPAFSRRIRTIELKMGVPLIDRTRKPIQAMPALFNLEPRLRDASEVLHELKRDLSSASSEHNELVLGGQHAISSTTTPMLVQAISEHADSRIRLRSANREDCLSLLFTRQIDIALLYRLVGEDTSEKELFMDTHTLDEELLVPVISKQQHANFNTEWKKGSMRIIAYPRNVFLGDVMHRKLLTQLDDSIDVRWSTETALTSAALQLALSGNGVAWIPLTLAGRAIERKELIRLDPKLPVESMSIVAHKLAQQEKAHVTAAWHQITSGQPFRTTDAV